MVFSTSEGFVDLKMQASCGYCKSCRIRRSREWALRCENEMQLHSQNCFITLTYAPEFLPEGNTLVKAHFSAFVKRLRERITEPTSPHFVSEDIRIKYYAAGEYGGRNGRPHYHAIIFGFDFSDKFSPMKTSSGCVVYRSKFLEELWTFGYSSVGTANFQSAGYCARYIMKKVNGDSAKQHYQWIDPDSGEVFDRVPEFNLMSRRTGIGKDWFLLYKSDVFPRDQVISLAGKRLRPPRYYDSIYEVLDPDDMSIIKDNRRKAIARFKDDNTYERLEVKAKVLDAKLKFLKREL